jgi:hypothetical protein
MLDVVYILVLAIATFAFGFVVIAGPNLEQEDVRSFLLLAMCVAGAINLMYIPSSPMNRPDMYGFFGGLAFYLLTSFAGFVYGRRWRERSVSAYKTSRNN